MSLRDFWDATPRDIQNTLKGATDYRKAESEERWLIARCVAINTIGAMTGYEKLTLNRVPFFPKLDMPDVPKEKVWTDDHQRMSEAMDRIINDPDHEWEYQFKAK